MGRGFIVLVIAAALAAGCGGRSAQPPSAGAKKACAVALYKLDVRVWLLHQPINQSLDAASGACYWVPKSKLRAATAGGEADYRARVRAMFGG